MSTRARAARRHACVAWHGWDGREGGGGGVVFFSVFFFGGGTCARMHCAQKSFQSCASQHVSAAPSIMVNTSNSISFLDS